MTGIKAMPSRRTAAARTWNRGALECGEVAMEYLDARCIVLLTKNAR
jgi:hypothetical protein